jgi:Skp family chaperone for outer membrane proteins
MKLILIIPILLLSTAARAETAYVDLAKVRAAVYDTDEAKQAAQAISSEKARNQSRVDESQEAAKKAKPADVAAANARTQQLFRSLQAELTAHENAADAKLMERPTRIAGKIATERKLTTIAPLATVLYASPKLDITEEVLKRYKAGAGFTTEEEAAKLRAEKATADATLKAKDAEIARLTALTKPPAPAVPPAPPAAPALAAKSKK